MSASSEPQAPPVEAFMLLRKGAVYNLVSAIIAIIGAVFMLSSLASIYQGIEAGLSQNLQANIAAVASTLIIAGIILLAAIIVYILGWLKFNAAAARLAEYSRERYSIGYTGTRLFIIGLVAELIGLLLLVGGAAAASITVILGSFALVAIGGIAGFIGMILFDVMLIRLGEVDATFKTAGIILLIGIILSLITETAIIGTLLLLVGYYLVYSAAGRAAGRIQQATTQ